MFWKQLKSIIGSGNIDWYAILIVKTPFIHQVTNHVEASIKTSLVKVPNVIFVSATIGIQKLYEFACAVSMTSSKKYWNILLDSGCDGDVQFLDKKYCSI